MITSYVEYLLIVMYDEPPNNIRTELLMNRQTSVLS